MVCMSETEAGTPTIRDLIQRAVKEALPREQAQKLVDNNEFSPQGTLTVKTPQELEELIKTIRDMFPREFSHLSDGNISEMVEHEQEHISQTKGEYEKRGIRADYNYGIRFGNDGGNLVFMPIYYIVADSSIPDDVLKKTAEAPKNLSQADTAKAKNFS